MWLWETNERHKHEVPDKATVSDFDSSFGDSKLVSSTPIQQNVAPLKVETTDSLQNTMATGDETSATTSSESEREFLTQLLSQFNQSIKGEVPIKSNISREY